MLLMFSNAALSMLRGYNLPIVASSDRNGWKRTQIKLQTAIFLLVIMMLL